MFYLIPGMILIAVLGIRKTMTEGYYKTMVLFVVLWILAFVYSVLVVYDVPIPTPLEVITWIISFIYGILF